MHSPGIHKSRDEGNYRQLGESKSHYTKWKSQDGKKDGVLLLGHIQGVEMSAITITDSHDSDGDLAPLKDLCMVRLLVSDSLDLGELTIAMTVNQSSRWSAPMILFRVNTRPNTNTVLRMDAVRTMPRIAGPLLASR